MPRIVDHAERREKIAAIVAGLLADLGVENTTIRKISHQSGLSRGLIEHYFTCKEEMISFAVKWINEQTLARVVQEISHLKGLAALRRLTELTLPLTEQSRREWKVRLQFWGLAVVNKKHQIEQTKRIAVVEELFIKHLKEAQEIGEINAQANLELIAHSLLHRTYGLSCNAILRSGYFTAERQLLALDHIMQEIAN